MHVCFFFGIWLHLSGPFYPSWSCQPQPSASQPIPPILCAIFLPVLQRYPACTVKQATVLQNGRKGPKMTLKAASCHWAGSPVSGLCGKCGRYSFSFCDVSMVYCLEFVSFQWQNGLIDLTQSVTCWMEGVFCIQGDKASSFSSGGGESYFIRFLFLFHH